MGKGHLTARFATIIFCVEFHFFVSLSSGLFLFLSLNFLVDSQMCHFHAFSEELFKPMIKVYKIFIRRHVSLAFPHFSRGYELSSLRSFCFEIVHYLSICETNFLRVTWVITWKTDSRHTRNTINITRY